MSLGTRAVVVFALGAIVLLLVENTALRAIAAVVMIVGIAISVFAIATHDFVRGDEVREDRV
jgi:hypothetical protein